MHAGYRTIVGLDEVGRGALAGPIAAAAVVLPSDLRSSWNHWERIRDSKLLSAQRREECAATIRQHAVACEVAMIDPATIDDIGISAANRLAMEMALHRITHSIDPDFLMIDAMTIDHGLPQLGIIDGDARSLTIAAASIVAKVHRDAYMVEIGDAWPDYQWHQNKGYGVLHHLQALKANGPCPYHRMSFRPVADCAELASD